MMAKARAVESMKMLLSSPFARFLQDKIHVVEGGNGKIVCEMQVEEAHTNLKGMLHGGLMATLVDLTTSAALATTERQVIGLSIDMNITFLSSTKAGEKVLIEAETLKIGKNIAFMSVDIRNQASGAILAQGRHTKYVAVG